MNRLCERAGVSRAGYYRFLRRAPSRESDVELRSAMQKIALEWRRAQAALRRRAVLED